MSSAFGLKHYLAITYSILYACTVLWAMGTSSGASGGMAFVLPVILGLPWSLLFALLLVIAPVPKIFMVLLLLVAPPALNVFLLLRIKGVFSRPSNGLNSEMNNDSSDANDDAAK